jgi:hypothetical protein
MMWDFGFSQQQVLDDSILEYSTLMMEAEHKSETSDCFKTTRCYIPEKCHLQGTRMTAGLTL